MAELAALTKEMDFHLEQVQDFTPTPMTVSTETWYSGYHPYTLEAVYSAQTPQQKLRQRMFFFWYKPEERAKIQAELRRMNRPDLIQKLYGGLPERASMPASKPQRKKRKTRDDKSHSFNSNFSKNNKRRH